MGKMAFDTTWNWQSSTLIACSATYEKWVQSLGDHLTPAYDTADITFKHTCTTANVQCDSRPYILLLQKWKFFKNYEWFVTPWLLSWDGLSDSQTVQFRTLKGEHTFSFATSAASVLILFVLEDRSATSFASSWRVEYRACTVSSRNRSDPFLARRDTATGTLLYSPAGILTCTGHT